VIVAVLLFILAAGISRGDYYVAWTTDEERNEAKTTAIVLGSIYIISFFIQIIFMASFEFLSERV
jgi:folylpolyglutamate synthase/dihydropteroate synthase